MDITAAGIAINGTMVFLNNGGSAGSGSGCSPKAPDSPVDPIDAAGGKAGGKAAARTVADFENDEHGDPSSTKVGNNENPEVVQQLSEGAKFRGDPHAFGNGARSSRATALVNEAAEAAGIKNLNDYVDDVLYDSSSAVSYFEVWNGKRTVVIGSETFGKTKAGQLIEASHELVHAQEFARVLKKNYGNMSLAEHVFNDPDWAFGTKKYAWGEMLAERLARKRVSKYLGGLTPQQRAASTKYINGWRDVFRSQL